MKKRANKFLQTHKRPKIVKIDYFKEIVLTMQDLEEKKIKNCKM